MVSFFFTTASGYQVRLYKFFSLQCLLMTFFRISVAN